MNPSRLLSVLVENRPGVLNRVASMIRRRGFNIDSLSVGPTEDDSVSRMTIAVHVGRQQAEQATRQLAKLIDVISIDDITGLRNVAHELLLIRMNAPVGQRTELLQVVNVFLGRIVDIASSTMIIEVTGTPEKIDTFVELMRPFGIKEVARSGAVALVRGDQTRLSPVDLGGDAEAAVPPGLVRVGGGADTTGDI